jgi:CheY-like chemotaxis protein
MDKFIRNNPNVERSLGTIQKNKKRKILVMDNEEILRVATSQMLAAVGCTVYVAGNGHEAIERYREAKECKDPFDAVILDLNIPNGKGGKETIRELLVMDPEVKAIISSGDISNTVVTDFEAYGFKGVLNKPFSMDELEQVLHKVLDADRA